MIKIKAVWLPDLSSFDLSNYEIEIPEELSNKECSLKLNRNEDFELYIEASFTLLQFSIFLDDINNYKAGEIRSIDKRIIMSSKNRNEKMEFNKVYLKQKFGIGLPPNKLENGKTRQGKFFSKTLEHTKDKNLIEKSSIDWIVNIDFSEFCSKNCYMRIYDNHIQFEKEYIENEYKNQIYHDHRDCFSITIDDVEIYIGKISEEINNIEKKYKSGFIYFSKKVTDDFKENILEALSFLFGRPLIKLGSSHFDEKGEVIANNFISPYIIDGKIFNYPIHPPCPYSESKQKNDITFDYDFIESFVSGFIKQYDEKNLKHVFWMYWHSVFSPIHTQASGYGAVIEYILNTKKEEKILNKSDFKKLKNALVKLIDDNNSYALDDIEKLKTNIERLNSLSNTQLKKKKFKELGIDSNTFENNLWQLRHDSAHGNDSTSKKDFKQLIREIYGFQSLCNRVILKHLNLSDHYYDYYNYDHPINEITQSIEDLEKVKKTHKK